MGFLILPIDEVDPAVHARIYEHARINQKGSVFHDAQKGQDALAAEAAIQEELSPEQKRIFRDDFVRDARPPACRPGNG